MGKNRQATGQITLRCPVQVHEELLEIAGHLGIDLTALLSQMINDCRPAYLERARKVVEEHRRARTALDRATLVNNPLVRQMIESGRPLTGKKRLRALTEVAVRHRRDGDPSVEDLVRFTLRALEEEDQLRQIEAMRAQLRRELRDPAGDDPTLDWREETRPGRVLD